MHSKVQTAQEEMAKVVESAKSALADIRTGRANPGLLSRIQVDSYGSRVPIQQLGSIDVLDAKTLLISLYDKTQVTNVEKALAQSELGVNTSSEGPKIRVTLPIITQERRLEFTKLAKQKTEEFRVSLRNIRQKIRQEVNVAVKAGALSENEQHSIEKDLDKTTNEFVHQIDQIYSAKEAELKAI
jgi:ribosome recycling factor